MEIEPGTTCSYPHEALDLMAWGCRWGGCPHIDDEADLPDLRSVSMVRASLLSERGDKLEDFWGNCFSPGER